MKQRNGGLLLRFQPVGLPGRRIERTPEKIMGLEDKKNYQMGNALFRFPD